MAESDRVRVPGVLVENMDGWMCEMLLQDWKYC